METVSSDQAQLPTFAELLAQWLRRRHLPQANLARMTGLSPGYICNLLADRKVPNADVTSRIAEALAMSGKQAAALHRAAARRFGFKLGPPRRLPGPTSDEAFDPLPNGIRPVPGKDVADQQE